MTTFLRIIFLASITNCCFAQIPAGYYDSAYIAGNAKICANLKTALFKIITADTINIPYNAPGGAFDSRKAMNFLDVHRNDNNTADIIWDMYTDNPTGPELYTFTPVVNQCGNYTVIGDCYNREHSFPVAWFGDMFPMKSDMHHIFGTDGFTNGKHDNFPFGEVNPSAINWQSPAGAKLGASSFTGYTARVFEPIDAYKGDFARAMFYMVTCYENSITGWQFNASADSVLNGTAWPALDNWAIRQWYKWHIQDPVSQKEIVRNNGVFGFQNNRNPFIDHPEFVALIWQCTGLVPVTLIDFKAGKTNANAVSLKWETTRETNFRQYEIERSTDGIVFNRIAIVSAQNLQYYTAIDNNLPAATTVFYKLKMLDADGKFTYSKIVSVRLYSNSGILLFPNPSKDAVTIKLQKALSENATIKVLDILGRIVAEKKLMAGQNAISLNIAMLSEGKYIIQIQTKAAIVQETFMKLK